MQVMGIDFINDAERLRFEASTQFQEQPSDAADALTLIWSLHQQEVEEPENIPTRAVLVTIRVENTEKLGDLLDYLTTHELEFEAEE